MDIEAIYQRGLELRLEGNYAEAKPHLEQVLSAQPKHVGARYQLALMLQYQDGDFDGSLAALEALAREVPNNLDIRYDFAMTQMMLGMYEEACQHLKFILSVDPTHAKAQQQVIYC